MTLKMHKAVVGVAPAQRTYFFLAPENTYAGLADETGVVEALETEDDEVPNRVSDLLANGALIRVAVSYTVGLKKKTGKLLVQKDKLATALGTLDDKAFRGGTIKSARVPRRMSFY